MSKFKWQVEDTAPFQDQRDSTFWVKSVVNHRRTLRIARVTSTDPKECETYAKLIAAAPELLEALKAFYLTYKEIGIEMLDTKTTQMYLDAEAAIQKAEGGQ